MGLLSVVPSCGVNAMGCSGLRLGTPDCAEAQLRVSDGMVADESRVREIRTLGSTSGEGSRGPSGIWGSGKM